MTNNLICLHWNARGLTKSRLEEFRVLLNQLDPDLVFLSETHWSHHFNVKFKFYYVLKRDRLLHRGGGVALLIKKSIQFSVKPPINLNVTEAIGATISPTQEKLTVFPFTPLKGIGPQKTPTFFINYPSFHISRRPKRTSPPLGVIPHRKRSW
jgi:hypothetical protein